MADETRMTDEAQVVLNPPELPVEETNVETVPARPENDDVDAWVNYVVSLGADRTFVTEGSEHYDDARQEYVETTGFLLEHLKQLADHLEGNS